MSGDMSCDKHRKYRAINRPRSNCEACWALFFKKKGGLSLGLARLVQTHRIRYEGRVPGASELAS